MARTVSLTIKHLENVIKQMTEEQKETEIIISVDAWNKLVSIKINFDEKPPKTRTEFTPRPKTKFSLKNKK